MVDLCSIWFPNRALPYPEICSYFSSFHICKWFRATGRVSRPEMLALILVLLVEFTSFKQISSSLKCVDWTRWFQSPPEVSSFRVSFFYFPHPRHTTQASSPLPFSIANTTGSRGAYSGWSDCQTPGRSWGHFQFWARSSCSGMHTWEWNVLGSGSSFLPPSTQL